MQAGATHLAFGGLARCPTPYVKELINELTKEISSSRKFPSYIHFFALARVALFPQLKQLEDLGITVGFDSASYLRKAWLSAPTSQTNYLTLNGHGYTAIRIPFTKKQKPAIEDPKNKEIEHLEQNCLKQLWKFQNKENTVGDVLSATAEYSRVNGKGGDLSEFYKRTLCDRSWDNCDCPICSKIGINVIVFRGNNRNRRRGFHNVNVFYKILKNEKLWNLGKNLKISNLKSSYSDLSEIAKESKTLIITGCTKKKLNNSPSLKAPAKEMYQGRLFKKVRAYAEAMNFDYLIISAKYGLLQPSDVIEGYEKMLKTNKDVENIRPSIEKSLLPLLKNYNQIVVIAGENYRKTLYNLWDDRFFYIKSRGYADLCNQVAEVENKSKKHLTDFTQ
jgi:hypothetical protein